MAAMSMKTGMHGFVGFGKVLKTVLNLAPVMMNNEATLRALATVLFNVSISAVNNHESTLELLADHHYFISSILGQSVSL